MMKKLVLPVAILLLVAIAGYFIISLNGTSRDGSVTKTGQITSVSLDQIAFDGPALLTMESEDGEVSVIAVPSMGLSLCAASENIADVSIAAVGDRVSVTGALDEEGRIVPCEGEKHALTLTGFMKDSTFGFQFEYRKGPNGYVTLEDTGSTDPDYTTGITLINQKEYTLLMESDEAREGPPALSVRVYRNDEKLSASVWAMRKPLESNIERILGETKETVVGGANAVAYTADGLYPTDTYVVANGNHVYVLAGAYLSQEDAEHADMKALVSSFTFVETPSAAPQGKVDIRVVCESALAYMSFPSGAEADAFVEACVRGEHPEVLERYLKEQNLDGATI